MEDDVKTSESQKKPRYRHMSSENLLRKSKLIHHRRHKKLTEKFLVPLKVPFGTSVYTDIMSRGDSVANAGYKLNVKTIPPQVKNTEKVLNCKNEPESQINVNCYKKLNQSIVEAYYNICSTKTPQIKKLISKSCSETLTPRIEEVFRRQHTEDKNFEISHQVVKKKIRDNNSFLESEQLYSSSDSDSQNFFVPANQTDTFLKPPGFKHNGYNLQNDLNKSTTEYSSTDLSECQIRHYDNRNSQNFNIKNNSAIVSQHIQGIHENNESSESHIEFHSAINTIISSETSSSESGRFYKEQIFQKLNDDSSDTSTGNEVKPLNDSWTTVSSTKATEMCNITSYSPLFLKSNNYSQLNEEHSLSDVIIKTLKLERNKKYNEKNMNNNVLNDKENTSNFTKKLIACMTRSPDDNPGHEDIKQQLMKECDREKSAKLLKLKNEIATPANEVLQSRIREVKQNMPSDSPIQALIEVCGAQSHITEILNKSTKTLQNNHKFQKLDPRFRTIKNTEDEIKIADNDSDGVLKLSENVFSKPLISSSRFKKLIDEFVENDYNNSVKSYRTAPQSSIESEFHNQPLSLQQSYPPGSFSKMPSKIENNKCICNLPSNLEKHFRDLDRAINNIKEDVTQLLFHERICGRTENKLQNERLDCEQLYKKYTEIEYMSSETEAVKSCVGTGFAISFILLFCLMCGSFVSGYLK